MELCQVSILKVRVEQFKCSLPQNLNMLITFFAHHCFFYFLGGWLYSSSSKLFLVVSTRISLCLKNLYFSFMLDHGLTKSRRVDGHFTLEYWHVQLLWTSQLVLVVRNLPANAGDIRDTGLVPRLGRSPAGEHGHPLQYSCLENSMDRGAWLQSIGSQRVRHGWSNFAHAHAFSYYVWKKCNETGSTRLKTRKLDSPTASGTTFICQPTDSPASPIHRI